MTPEFALRVMTWLESETEDEPAFSDAPRTLPSISHPRLRMIRVAPRSATSWPTRFCATCWRHLVTASWSRFTGTFSSTTSEEGWG